MSGLVLLLVLGCEGLPLGGADPAPETLDPEVVAAFEDPDQAGVLDDKAFRFCHEAGVWSDEARPYCELLEDLPPDRCPGLRETCAGAAHVPVSAGCNEGGGGGGAGSESAGGPSKPDRPQRRPEACEMPESPVGALSSLVRWVVAILVAVGLLFLVRFLFGFLGVKRVPQVEPVEVVIDEAPEMVELEDVPNLPSADLLAAARKALAEGRYGEAVMLSRGAALRRLGDVGRLRLHRSRTDREYARSLRADEQLHPPLEDVLRAAEIHRWGGALLDAARSEQAVSAAAAILKVVAMLLLCVPGLRAEAQEVRYAPFGDAALHGLLDAWGYDVRWRLRGLGELDQDTDVLVLDTAFVRPDDDGWAALYDWVSEGGVLWVAGDCPWEELGDWVPGGSALVEGEGLGEVLLPTPRLPYGPNMAWQEHEGDAWVTDGVDGVVVWVPIGAGAVLAMSDSRLVWNGAFVHPDNEAFVGDLLNVGEVTYQLDFADPPVVELATTAASESPSPSQSILNADLLPFMVQLMLTWLLLGLWRGLPFGPLKDSPERGRLSFAEHIRALGTRWFRLGDSRHALAAYARLWLGRLGPGGIRAAARRAGRDQERAEALVVALEAAVETPGDASSEHDLEWMEELWTVTRNR